ncbi:vWA domain-containing protein [Azotobacter salinestris]|uniref:vWA domain-containing protein n=1 Tax=Azotobacter salinestris TaxID=69964 RepID=UPI0032DF6E15
MSAITPYKNDLIENPSPRCPCMVVLDTSGSMSGEPIAQLNAGLAQFLQAVREDEVAAYSVEVGVITAGNRVREQLPFTTATHIEGFATLEANGTTPLGEAINLALDRLEARKAEYRKAGVAYYQPWLVIISDGEPTDEWQEAARRAQEFSLQRKLVSLPVGVSSANLSVLGQFSSRPALRLQGLRFAEFFQWLSASMSRVSASASTSASVQLPAMDGWASI